VQHRVAVDPVSGRLLRVAVVVVGEWISGTAFACAESLRAICGVAGFTPLIAMDSNRYPTTLAMVAAGHGVALVPASALTGPAPGVVARPLRPAPPPRRIWAVTLGEPTPPTAHFLDCLAATATGTPPAGR
jgi:DNA-binding transcriptional LysR family regulator